VLVAVAGLLFAPPGEAKPKPFLLGVVDDAGILAHPQHRAAAAKVGFGAVRAVVHWRPGMRADEVAIAASPGVRVLLSALGPAAVAPVTVEARADYCSFLVAVVRRHPHVRDVLVWNEPGLRSYFWPRGIEDPIGRYVQLLRECYEALHAEGVRVVGPATHVPLPEMRLFARALAANALLWRRPLLDVFAVNAYGLTGQTRAVIALLDRELALTPQPSPASGLPLWYTEHGIESRPERSMRHLYVGRHGHDDAGAVSEAEQAHLLDRHVLTAYCTPGVEGYFSFLLRDEANLAWSNGTAGFQTGLLRPDWSPKPSYLAMRSLAARLRRGLVGCGAAA
jgi:hypothetical protein